MGLRERSKVPSEEASCSYPPSPNTASPPETKKRNKQHKKNKPSLIVTLRVRFQPPEPSNAQPHQSPRSPTNPATPTTLGKRKRPPVDASLPTPPITPVFGPTAPLPDASPSPKSKPAARPTTAKTTRRTAPTTRQRQSKPAKRTQPTAHTPTLDLPPLPPPDPRAGSLLTGGPDYSPSMAHWIESVARERAKEDAERQKRDVVTDKMEFGGPKWPQREYPGGPWKEC